MVEVKVETVEAKEIVANTAHGTDPVHTIQTIARPKSNQGLKAKIEAAVVNAGEGHQVQHTIQAVTQTEHPVQHAQIKHS